MTTSTASGAEARFRDRYCDTVAALVCAGLTVTTASAGAQEAENGGLQEVTVTARYVTESLQTTPVAISSVSAAELEARGVSDIAGLARGAPNVTLQEGPGGFGKSAVAYIRGVGQHDALPAFEPGVGFYLNGVYHGTLFGAPLQLTDIDHVEILRGPQGTLFGKSNEGGAVRIVTPDARGTNTGYVQLGYGGYNREQVRGAYDLSVIPDKLFMRISGGFNSIDGYVDQIDFACAHPTLAGTLPRTARTTQNGSCKVGTLGGDTVQAGRIDLRYIASDSLELKLAADVSNDKGTPGGEVLMAINPAVLGQNGVPWTGVHPVGPTSPYGIPFDERFITGDHYSTYTTFFDPNTGMSFPARDDMKSWGVTGTVSWDLGRGVQLKNILAYREYQGQFIEIWANAPWQINDNYFEPYHNQLSEELNLSGTSFGSALDWTVGGYFYHSRTELNDFIYIAFVPVAFDGNPAFYGKDPVRDEDRSGFVHGLYHVTDKFGLEAGVRYTDTTKEYTFNRLLFNPATPNAPVQYLTGFNPDLVQSSGTTRFDYRYAMQYQWTKDFMSYVSYATGFKGPGINPRPQAAIFATPFAEEDLKSYEVGTKIQSFDNRLRTNLAAFLSDYTNLQLSIPVNIGGVPGSTISNAGKVRITGFEVELQAEPAIGLFLDASLAYLKYDIRELGAAANVPGSIAKGYMAPYVPEWKGSLGVQYAYALGASAGALTPRLDYSYQSKSFADPNNNPYSEIPAYGVLDFHLSYDTASSDWQARLDVSNVTNKFYWANVYSQYNAGGMVVGRPSLPRTWFVTVKRSF